jgi:hypothetical protein
MSPSPGSDLSLSDDLFLVAHCDRSGRPRLHPLVCGVVLGGGLLGEMLLAGQLGVAEGRIRLLGPRPPEDRTCRALFDALAVEPHRDLRAWLDFLSRSATAAVAARLVVSGWVVPVHYRRGLFGRGTAYRPADADDAYWRSVRLSRTLLEPTLSPGDTLLAGLVEVCGLLPVATDGDGATWAVGRIERALTRMGGGADELLDTVRLSVGDAVLGART